VSSGHPQVVVDALDTRDSLDQFFSPILHKALWDPARQKHHALLDLDLDLTGIDGVAFIKHFVDLFVQALITAKKAFGALASMTMTASMTVSRAALRAALSRKALTPGILGIIKAGWIWGHFRLLGWRRF
jgi:hypothetical protein